MRLMVKLLFRERIFKMPVFRARVDGKRFEIELFENGSVRIIMIFLSKMTNDCSVCKLFRVVWMEIF